MRYDDEVPMNGYLGTRNYQKGPLSLSPFILQGYCDLSADNSIILLWQRCNQQVIVITADNFIRMFRLDIMLSVQAINP